MAQLEMFAPPAARRQELPTADSIRPRLNAVLDQLRDGTARTWSDAERRRWFVVFPQMCEWLPAEEREIKREQFSSLIS